MEICFNYIKTQIPCRNTSYHPCHKRLKQNKPKWRWASERSQQPTLTSEYSTQDPSPRFVPIASMHGKEKPSPAKKEGHQRQITDQQLSVLTLRKPTCNFIKKSLRQCGKEITQQGRFEGIQVKHLGKVRTTVSHFHFQKPGRPCFKAMEPKGTTTWSAPMTTL